MAKPEDGNDTIYYGQFYAKFAYEYICSECLKTISRQGDQFLASIIFSFVHKPYRAKCKDAELVYLAKPPTN